MLCKNRLKKYSRRERNLIYTVSFLICVVLIFIIVLIVRHGSNICLTPICIKTATYFINSIDPHVAPCDNFHEFVCGGFLKKSMILREPSHLYGLGKRKDYQMRQIVAEPPDEENMQTPKSVYLQKKFYSACENTTAIDNDDGQTFMDLIDEVIGGGWPMKKGTAWNDRDFDWVKSMEKARNAGLEYRFFFDVTLTVMNMTKILKIRPSSFSITVDNDMPTIISVRRFSEQLQQIVEKAKKLTSFDEPKKTTISKLNLSLINWLPFLKNITGLQQLQGTDEIVIDGMDEYFKDLDYLLMKTPKRDQANYIVITNVQKFSAYFYKKVRDDFSTAHILRSDFCFKEALAMFPSVAEGEYVRKYATEEVKGSVKTMINLIKKEFKYAIQSNKFMDDETKKNSLELLAVIKENVGWMDNVYDVDKYENIFGYDKLILSSTNNVFTMAREMKKFNRDLFFQMYTKPFDDRSDLEHPRIDLNAYFIAVINELMLAAPFLQPPVFELNRPKYLNFGTLGSIAGHELAHGFSDDRGKNIGDAGNVTVWTNETVRKYEKLKRCVVDDYERYPYLLDNFSKNGTTVLQELIADFTGADLSYRAYQKWFSENGQEASLPGLPYNANQMFWISLGSLYCYQYNLRDLDDIINIDGNHPVPSYRIVGTMKNSPYFAEAFNCPVETNMNPKEKCRIFL